MHASCVEQIERLRHADECRLGTTDEQARMLVTDLFDAINFTNDLLGATDAILQVMPAKAQFLTDQGAIWRYDR